MTVSKFLLSPAVRSPPLTLRLSSVSQARSLAATTTFRLLSNHSGVTQTTDSSRLLTAAPSLSNLTAMTALLHTSSGLRSEEEGGKRQLDKVGQLKQAVKDYGATVIVFHVGISLMSLGFFYAIVSSGLDVVSLVSRLPWLGEHLSDSAVAAGATTFVMAYAVHKVFAPVRIGITLSSAPFIVRYLRSKGILKVKKP